MSAEKTDRQLLEGFVKDSGEAAEEAFATLLERHGPMVFGVCRSLLDDPHRVEDAFQAVFLVLARKADTLRKPESLAPWLHGVALRTARKAKALAVRQHRRERPEAMMGVNEPVGELGGFDLRLVQREEAEVLHEEVARLPECYRAPVVLCYLEGLTHAEAAARLSWPVGTLSVRLMRARHILRARLARRGLAPASGLLALVILPENASAAVPAHLARSTVAAAVQMASGQALTSGIVSFSVSALVEEVLGGLLAGVMAPALAALTVGLVATCATVFANNPRDTVTPVVSREASARRELKPFAPAATNDAQGSSVSDSSRPAKDAPEAIASVTPLAPSPHDDALKAYRERALQANKTPDAQVRLALWCESHGLAAERLKHLALAVLTDPTHSAARGLLGQVASEGRWRRAEDLLFQARSDANHANALAEYNARRERMENSAEAHWRLALWCDRHDLKPEATAHLIAVTRLAPGNESAWKRLGYQRYHGRWRTELQIARERAELEAQKEADRYWKARLNKWRVTFRNPKTRPEAVLALADVSDPRALNSVLIVFGNGDALDQTQAVQLLGQIDSPGATRSLALFAIGGATVGIRRAACEILARRDHREALGLLIAMLRDPEPNPNTVVYRFQMVPVGALGYGSPGVTIIEGQKANLLAFYTIDESISFPASLVVSIPPSLVEMPNTSGSYVARASMQNERQLSQLNMVLKNLIIEAAAEAAAVRSSIRRFNAQLILSLKNISGIDREGNWESWKRWWVEEQGYAYDPQLFRTPPDDTINQPKPTYFTSLHLSCFAMGTLVRTSSGLRPIESIRVGDQVLAQDTRTGSLSFEPVVAALRNPPDAMVRVELAGETLAATGIHRFWKAGHGWVMARDLKPGDPVRVLGGIVPVRSVTPLPSQPVFNLEVANSQSYFVGRQGVLVHDNSEVIPITQPFDAVAEIVAPSQIPLIPSK